VVVAQSVQNCSKAVLLKALRISLIFLIWSGSQRGGEILIVQDYIKQRAMDLQSAIVVNENQLPEPVHEKNKS